MNPMPFPENYEDILRNLGFAKSQGQYYYPQPAPPHLHVSVEGPQMHGGRVAGIVGTTAGGVHTNYVVDGAVVGRREDLDATSPGWGDKAAEVLSQLHFFAG
jgi:hypothetical protein